MAAECPKCATPRNGEKACPKCGLAADKMSAFEATREANVPDALKEAWKDARANWGDPKRHRTLVELAAIHNAYAWVGSCYRDKAKAGDEIAVTQVEKLRKAAEATLFASATNRDDGARGRNWIIAISIALGVLLVFAGIVYFTARDKGASSPPPPPAQTR